MLRTKKYAVSAGFTLLELMVALALTGLLTLVAFTSLNLSLKTVRRGQAAAETLQELRVGQNILERSLSSAIQGIVDNRIYFVGEPQQLRFFTLLPLEAHNLGGVYHWRSLLGQDEAGKGVLAVEQTKNLNWRRDPEGVEIRQIIIRNVAALRFTYGRGSEEFSAWDGKREGSMPDWVKVQLTLTGQEPQEWLIPIHVAENKIAQK